MDPIQLDLFAEAPPAPPVAASAAARQIVAHELSDAELIAALPDALLGEACALAAEAGRRRLGEAVVTSSLRSWLANSDRRASS